MGEQNTSQEHDSLQEQSLLQKQSLLSEEYLAQDQNKVVEQDPVLNMEPTQQYEVNQNQKKKKKHGCLISILVFIVVLGAALAGTYFFLPGLRKPNDLGVKASQAAYDSAVKKLTANTGGSEDGITVATEVEEDSSTYTATEVSAALTSEEITSLLTINRPEDYPLQDTQVRLNEDDTMEVSTAMDVNFLLEDILNNEITKEEIAETIPVLKDLPEEVNVYIKLEGSVDGNEVENFDIEKLSVMGVTIPENMIGSEDTDEFLIDSINSYLENKSEETGERYDALQVLDGTIIIDGAINLP